MSIYKTTKWLRKRSNILRRDSYECRQCRRYGKSTLANTVHHVIPLEDDPSLAYDRRNLISLCNACHEKMHNRSGDTLTKLGMEWVMRLLPDYTPHL